MSTERRLALQYDELCVPQKKIAMSVIENLNPRLGENILDMGCGTGEMTASIAELVGPDGKVVGVDPDAERINVAMITHDKSRNLRFEVGSSFGFAGEGEQAYDAVFSSCTFHWFSNKEEFFKKVYGSLKHGGRMEMKYLVKSIDLWTNILTFFGLEHQLKIIPSIWHYDDMSRVEEYARRAGFVDIHINKEVFAFPHDSIEELCDFIHATTNGVLDFSSIKNRLQEYVPSANEIENGKLIQLVHTETFSAKKE